MQNLINREAAITAFLAAFTPSLGANARAILNDPDFDLAKQCEWISLPAIAAIFARADKLTEALDEPSAWVLVDLAIIGAAALIKRNVHRTPQDNQRQRARPAASEASE
jgi:hypothetical protein